MEINDVKALLKQFDESSLTEFNLKKDTFELYMNKNKQAQKQKTTTPEVVVKESAQTAAAESVEVAKSAEPNAAVASVPVSDPNSQEIVSPLVGIVYLQPAPDKPSYKQVGDPVKQGEVVCIVEAMKLMNEITATVDGVITEILVENEQIVEFNQPLFSVSKGV